MRYGIYFLGKPLSLGCDGVKAYIILTGESCRQAFRLQPTAIINDGGYTLEKEYVLPSVLLNKIRVLTVQMFSFILFIKHAAHAKLAPRICPC